MFVVVSQSSVRKIKTFYIIVRFCVQMSLPVYNYNAGVQISIYRPLCWAECEHVTNLSESMRNTMELWWTTSGCVTTGHCNQGKGQMLNKKKSPYFQLTVQSSACIWIINNVEILQLSSRHLSDWVDICGHPPFLCVIS